VPEASFKVGDWVYYVHTKPSMDKFRDLAKEKGKGGAASGWNLVCTVASGEGSNKYMGFGMSDTESPSSDGLTAADIKKVMIKSAGGDPKAPYWQMYWRFRRVVLIDKLAELVNTKIKWPA
jgi:hypothetical protein